MMYRVVSMYRCIGCIADVSLMYRFVFCEALSRRGGEYTDVSRVMYRFVSLCIAAIHQIHHDTSRKTIHKTLTGFSCIALYRCIAIHRQCIAIHICPHVSPQRKSDTSFYTDVSRCIAIHLYNAIHHIGCITTPQSDSAQVAPRYLPRCVNL